MKKHYTKAVVELLLQGKDIVVVLQNLKKTLHKKGHSSIHIQILQAVLHELNRKSKSDSSVVVVSNENDAEKLKRSIEESLAQLGGNLKTASITTDKSLIGGFVASHKGWSIDASYKQKLVTLYRAITK